MSQSAMSCFPTLDSTDEFGQCVIRGPNSAPLLARFLLKLLQFCIIRGKLARPPTGASFDQFMIERSPIKKSHLCHHVRIAINLNRGEPRVLIEGETLGCRSGFFTVVLIRFGTINPG